VLVSMHGTALYERRERTPTVQAYLDEQRAFQQDLAASLGVPHEELARNQRLIWTFDALSLAVLLDWDPFSVEGVERRGATVEPWPFRDDSLVLRCDARRLDRRFDDQDEMLAALAAAPWESVEVRLERR
jgi:Protein of unknown function (DUF3891)